MAKGDPLTPYQKGVVRRYYEHRDNMMVQKLTEAVSELYLCDDEKKAGRLWKTVHTALDRVYPGKARIERIVAERDLEALAELVGKIF